MNFSYISYEAHDSALANLQKKFPSAIFNGGEFVVMQGKPSRQMITVVGVTATPEVRKQARKALSKNEGHFFFPRGSF